MSALDPERLARIGLFGGLDDETLEALIEHTEVRTHAAGDVIYEEGSPGRELYVVLSGRVGMHRGDEPLSEETPGTWFGEMSVLDMQPRAVSAVCVEDTQLLVLTARDCDWLYRKDPKRFAMLVMNIARQLSRKLRLVL